MFIRPNLIRPNSKNIINCTYGDFLDFFWLSFALLGHRCRAQLEEKPFHAVAFPFTECSIYGDYLRWMIYQGYIVHLRSFPNPANEPISSLRFDDSSCFVLTDIGEKFVDSLIDALVFHEHDDSVLRELFLGPLVPIYDPNERVFNWGRHLVKSFRQPARNQELILWAGQEMGWPNWFDDPLPRSAGRNPKKVLHDTIVDLSRRQLANWIRFKGDGTGRRVGWEIL
jgi:hypothetical protein